MAHNQISEWASASLTPPFSPAPVTKTLDQLNCWFGDCAKYQDHQIIQGLSSGEHIKFEV